MPWEELDEEYGGSWSDFAGDMDGQVTPVLEGAIEDLEDRDYVSRSFGMLGGLAAAAGAEVDFATELVGDRVDGVVGKLGWAVGAGVGYHDKDAGQYVEDAFDFFSDAIGWRPSSREALGSPARCWRWAASTSRTASTTP
jgi:hypothetical protein